MSALIDSGSKKNIIGSETWKYLNEMGAKIDKFQKGSDTNFLEYGNKSPLTVVGMVHLNVDISKTNIADKFYIVDGGATTIIGKITAEKLGVLTVELQLSAIKIGEKLNFKQSRELKLIFQLIVLLLQCVNHLDEFPQPTADKIRAVQGFRNPEPLEEIRIFWEL